MKHSILLFTVGLLFVSCSQSEDNPQNTIKQSTKFEVKYFGALKNMMHQGDISAKFDLGDLEGTKNLYAIGALENLKGEIQIFNGETFNSFVQDSIVAIDKAFNKKATLLVYSVVERWKSYNIPDDIVTYEQLEKHIASVAKKNGINIEKAFPFLIEGKALEFDWHVINWKDGDTEHSHEKHVNSGLNGTKYNQQVELLGFYSDSHHAVFTHHTTNMHIHVKTGDGKLAGHVDALTLGKDMVLKLPGEK
ncbi:MAG: decarboxylase [Bacteroidetes bacterium]|nr:MAG: decarboxylase [Bacteroidota bacterium]